MSIEYDLVSDSAREGYELGKGPWSDLESALRSDDPAREVFRLIVSMPAPTAYAAEITRDVLAFVAAHSDWRVSYCNASDILLVTVQRRAECIARGDDPDLLYRKVGSRYR